MRSEEVNFLTRFVVESDAIEGIENDLESVRRHVVFGSPRDSVGGTPGQVGAMLFLRASADVRRPLDESWVKTTQALIVREQHLKGERALEPRYVGQWRDFQITVGGRPGELPGFISTNMRLLIEDTRQWQHRRADTDSPEERVRFIARWHWRYERIHPFADGNGRSGRALVYYLHRFSDLQPFVFTAHDRHEEYYPCFDQTSPAMMEKYFVDRSPAIL